MKLVFFPDGFSFGGRIPFFFFLPSFSITQRLAFPFAVQVIGWSLQWIPSFFFFSCHGHRVLLLFLPPFSSLRERQTSFSRKRETAQELFFFSARFARAMCALFF